MAVMKMRKITVIGHAPLMDRVIVALQASDVLEIESNRYDVPNIELAHRQEALLTTFDEQLEAARFTRDFLSTYHVNTTKIAMFVSEKFHVSEDEFLQLSFGEHQRLVYGKSRALKDRLTQIPREIDQCETLVTELEPWKDCLTPISKWHDTSLTLSFTGTASHEEALSLKSRLAEISPLIDFERYHSHSDISGIKICCHESIGHAVSVEINQTKNYVPATFVSVLKDTPAHEIKRLLTKAEALHAESDELTVQATEVAAEEYVRMVALINMLESKRERVTVSSEFGATDATFVISGWTPARDEERLLTNLAAVSSDIDVTVSDPGEGDTPPVELDNPKWLKPYELITDLYGRPEYGELDPTLALAPFFTLFFAICIGDLGYGLMLIGIMWFIKNKLDVAPGVKQFTTMMMYGGATAIPVGILTGSYFALPFEELPKFLQNLRVLDPLGQIIPFLGVMLALGIIQIVVGILIATYDAFRKNDPATAIGNELSTLFLLAMIAAFAITGAKYPILLGGGLILTMILKGQSIPTVFNDRTHSMLSRLLAWIWLATIAVSIASFAVPGLGRPALIAFGIATVVGLIFSRTTRKALVGGLLGAYEVYGMTGILNDALSYTRLAALALSGALVGMVFNLLATLVWDPALTLIQAGGISILWGALIALMAATIFVVGHIFNVTINLLGAFVHPLRLQFVEFFGKFYKGGGESFKPFRYDDTGLVFDAEEIGEKGGTS